MSDCLFFADRRLNLWFKRTRAVSNPDRCCLRHHPFRFVAGSLVISGTTPVTLNKTGNDLVEAFRTNLPEGISGAQLLFRNLPGDFSGLAFVPAPLMHHLRQRLRWGWWVLVKLPGFAVDLINQLRCPHHRFQRQLGFDAAVFQVVDAVQHPCPTLGMG